MISSEMPQTPEAVALRLYQIITSQEANGGPRNRDYHLSAYADCLRAVSGKYTSPSSMGLLETSTAQTIEVARQFAANR